MFDKIYFFGAQSVLSAEACKYANFPKQKAKSKVELIQFMRSLESASPLESYPLLSTLYEILFIIEFLEFDTAALINTMKRKTLAIVFTPLLLISLFTLDCSPRSYHSRKRYQATITH